MSKSIAYEIIEKYEPIEEGMFVFQLFKIRIFTCKIVYELWFAKSDVLVNQLCSEKVQNMDTLLFYRISVTL